MQYHYYTKMAAQSKLDDSTIIGEDSSYFVCECGAQFQAFTRYSKHKLQTHSHKSQGLWGMIKREKEQKTAAAYDFTSKQDTNMEESMELDRGQSFVGIGKMGRQMRDFEKHRKVNFLLYNKKFANFGRKQQTREAQQEWNRYTLTKNHDCNREPYFCGSCSTVFDGIDKYVTHCVQDCQLFVHRKSSHFIKFNKADEAVQETSIKIEEKENGQQNIQNISKIQQIQQQVNIPSLSVPPSQPCLKKHQQNAAIDMEPIKQIFQKRLNHKAIPFYCGQCQQKLDSNNGYYVHILKRHHNVISPSSSHIILRSIRYSSSKTNIICISPAIQWMNEHAKYFCSCQPQQKITMKMLIRHVIEVHHGVSPLYQLSKQKQISFNLRAGIEKDQQFQQESSDASSQEDSQEEYRVKKKKTTLNRKQGLSTKEKPSKSKNDSMIKGLYVVHNEQNESMSDQESQNFQYIHNIFTYELDHKNLSPYCGLCQLFFERGFCYWHHIKKIHKQNIDSSCSHIVLKVCHKSHRYNLYLSNKVEWVTDTELYYCPCNKQLKMAMNVLINHVFDVHHGVSPKYIHKKSLWISKLANRQYHRANSLNQIENIKWNGFILTKNTLCTEQPFYCGNCKTIFANVEDFVTHCLDQCQVIDHKDASHFIEFRLKDKQVSRNLSQHSLEQTSILGYKDTQAIPQKQLLSNIKPICEIIKNNMDHSYLPFYCGLCQRSFTYKKGYFIHLLRSHKGFIQPSSSHIILYCINKSNKTMLIYLSTSQKWVNQDPIYFCPCSPKVKIGMKQLIQHVMKEHKGISPHYYIGKRIRPKPKQLKQNQSLLYIQDKIEQISKKKKDNPFQSIQQEQLNKDIDQSFQSIKQIFYYQLDHKDLPLYCGICQKYFSQGYGYWQHMTLLHNTRIDSSSSHIVLHIHGKYRSYFLYLTKNVKWTHDKALYNCPCNKSQKMAMSAFITHIFESHHGENDNMLQMYAQKNKNKYFDQRYSILSIMNHKLDHKNITFECKLCQKTFTRKQYKNHIKYIHNRNIDNTSSHIILRIIRAGKRNIYISQHIEWPIKESIYYCPCSPQQKMTMKLLIMHVFDQHGGISPVYYYYQKARLTNSRQSLKQEESKGFNPQKQKIIEAIRAIKITQEDPFLNIFRQSIDHSKIISFDCNSCKKTFSSNPSYLDHLLDANHSQQNPIQSCSHVIFRTSSSSERKTLYISPRIEWQDKRKIYYCPCQPDNKTTMKELLQHHITAHNFITPTYELSPIDEA